MFITQKLYKAETEYNQSEVTGILLPDTDGTCFILTKDKTYDFEEDTRFGYYWHIVEKGSIEYVREETTEIIMDENYRDYYSNLKGVRRREGY